MQTFNSVKEPTHMELFAHLLYRSSQLPSDQIEPQWLLLEAAHVMGQTHFASHLRVHVRMLALAWKTNDYPEITGQLFRITLVPLGHLLGRLPIGNPGRSNVSAFQPMQVSPVLMQAIEQSRAMVVDSRHHTK